MSDDDDDVSCDDYDDDDAIREQMADGMEACDAYQQDPVAHPPASLDGHRDDEHQSKVLESAMDSNS